jgi:hypothetical protein
MKFNLMNGEHMGPFTLYTVPLYPFYCGTLLGATIRVSCVVCVCVCGTKPTRTHMF